MKMVQVDSSIISLALFISLRIVDGVCFGSYTKYVAEGRPKCGNKLSTVIRKDVIGYVIEKNLVIQHNSYDVRRYLLTHLNGAS